MAGGLYIDTSSFKKGSAALKQLIAKFPEQVSDVLNASALEIEEKAKQNAPADRGLLRQTISADTSQLLVKKITANAPYAAYVEFGTGKFAAQQVAKYPPEYKAFAAQFKGKGGGGFPEFIKLLTEWVKRKGIDNKNPRSTAYAIAISILRNGIHPHPYMIPAVITQKKVLLDDFKTMVNKLKIV